MTVTLERGSCITTPQEVVGDGHECDGPGARDGERSERGNLADDKDDHGEHECLCNEHRGASRDGDEDGTDGAARVLVGDDQLPEDADGELAQLEPGSEDHAGRVELVRQLLNGVDLIRLVYRESHEEGGEPDGQSDEEPKGRHAEAQRADLRPFRRGQPAEVLAEAGLSRFTPWPPNWALL
jgi:hypothetical protein